MKERLDPTKLSPEAQKLKDFLSARMIGQRRAIDTVVKAYSLSLSRLARRNKPILTMFSAGPSAVGKTLLAQLVAEFFFGSRDALTKIPCEGFTEKHELAALLGSPPGYVGFDEPPMLAQEHIDRFAIDAKALQLKIKNDPELKNLRKQIRDVDMELRRLEKEMEANDLFAGKRNISDKRDHQDEDKLMERLENLMVRSDEIEQAARARINELKGTTYSIVLFDEIEKANPAVHNFLLGVLAEGRAKLMNGKDETSFLNSFIFMTSNVGSKEIAKLREKKPGLGFGNNPQETVDIDTAIYLRVMQEIKAMFPTEFIGRVKKRIVIFHPLPIEALRDILEISLAAIIEDMKRQLGAILTISNEAKEFILLKATDHPEYGARPIEEEVESQILSPLSNIESSGQLVPGDMISVELQEGHIVFLREGDLSKSPYLIIPKSEKPKK